MVRNIERFATSLPATTAAAAAPPSALWPLLRLLAVAACGYLAGILSRPLLGL